MISQENEIKAIPLRGGVDTYHEKLSIPTGDFSTLQNIRPLHPGFQKRKGQVLQHTTASGSFIRKMTGLAQFSKGKITERYFYRQHGDGWLGEATTHPPGITTGDFGTGKISPITGTIPCSSSTFDDWFIYSDGARGGYIFGGNTQPVKGFVVGLETGNWPTNYKDYTQEIVGTGTASLNALGAGVSFFLFSSVRIEKMNLTISAANTNASVLSGKVWSTTGWVSLAGFTDGTAVTGATLGQTGVVSWTHNANTFPLYRFGKVGFCYQFTVSATLSATVTLSEVTYDTIFRFLLNLWDGVMVPMIEARVYKALASSYQTFGSTSISVGSLKTADYVYFNSTDPLEGILLGVNVPQPKKITFTGSTNVDFVDGGVSNDYIDCTKDPRFVTLGFEAGMSIAITGTASNNITTAIISVTSSRIYVATGLLTAETSSTATITADNMNPSISAWEVWTGSAWEAITVDAFISTGGFEFAEDTIYYFQRGTLTPKKSDQFATGFDSYWYRFKVVADIKSSKPNISIEGIPYFDIGTLGNSITNTTWKTRMCYVFSNFPQYVHFSAQYSPQVLNGSDYGIMMAGDGRANRILSMKRFLNELLVWQEEKGELGGCTTLIQGYSPETFGRLVLSDRVGILNPKCSVVVENVPVPTEKEEKVITAAFWVSRQGVMTTDGRYIKTISLKIRNYFDPNKTECIRKGYEMEHWLAYDSTYKCLRMGLVSGASATAPNVFFSYDIEDASWSVDVLAQPLSSYLSIEAGSGDKPTMEVGGDTGAGFVYICNTGMNDNGTAITSRLGWELNCTGKKMNLTGEVIRVKAQTTGTFNRVVKKDGETGNMLSSNLSQTPEIAGNVFRRQRTPFKVMGNHFSVEVQHNTLDEDFHILDVGYSIEEVENNS